MKKKIEKFIEGLNKLTESTGLWLDEVYLNECNGFIRFDFNLQKYIFIKDK